MVPDTNPEPQVSTWEDTRVLVNEKSKDKVIMSTNMLAITHPTLHNGSEWDYAKEEFLSAPDYWLNQYTEGKYIPSKALWQICRFEANKYSRHANDYMSKV